MGKQRITTPLFEIEAPTLFEKALVMGQLLRLERMDRAAGEESFAEVNLFVGFADEERLEPGPPSTQDGPTEGAEELLLESLWQKYWQGESALGEIEVVEDSKDSATRYSILRLAGTSWRPESGALVWISVLPSGERPVFARMVLEFDWALRSDYVAVGRDLLTSLTWTHEVVTPSAVAAQAQHVWSVFDAMDPAKREAIAKRYQEIIGRSQPAPEPKAEPTRLDLASMDLDALTPAELERLLRPDGSGGVAALVQTEFFDDPIKWTIELDQSDGYQIGEGTIGILRALKALGPKDRSAAGKLLWEHCKICFDATDYGAPGHQSNEDYFGIHGPDDALREATSGSIYLHENLGGGSHDLFQIDFYPVWEDEHGCSLVVREGEFYATSDPGGYLGEFEITGD